jgi:D-alanine-D-alanine ligase
VKKSKLRIMTLCEKRLVPPDVAPPEEALAADWKMEFDVITTLKKRKHDVLVVGVDSDLTPIKPAIEEFKPDIVFNLMDAFADVGTFDQNVVSYLELLRVPYTGCNPRGMTLTRDKALAKKLMAYHRIPVPDFAVVPLNHKPKLPKRLKYPLIVKSLTYESSTGISQASVVTNDEQLNKRVQYIHDTILTPAILEEFVEGRELYVGVLGNQRLQVLPVWEMSFAKMTDQHWKIATDRVKWSLKYQKKHGIDTAAADLPEDVCKKIQHLAKRTFKALDMNGYGRIDFRTTTEGKIYVIEANPNAQLAQDEDFAQSAKKAGIPYGRLLERVMAIGLQWQPTRMAYTPEA